MKYILALSLLLGCTKPMAPTSGKSESGPTQAAKPETNASTGPEAPMTPSHAMLPLHVNAETGAVGTPYQPNAREQKQIDALNEEAKSYVQLKAKQKEALATFKQTCASCHGLDGRGSGPAAGDLPVAPTNFHEWPIKYGRTPGDIAYTLLQGRNDQAMPALGAGMKKEQLWSLVFLISAWIEARPDQGNSK